MYKFIEDVLKEATNDMKGTSPAPEAATLFNIDGDLSLLDTGRADYSHQMEAQMLFHGKKGQSRHPSGY